MKKIIIFLIFGFISLYAKPCMTDIYFGNGVWNTEKEAIYSKNRLRYFMLFGTNILLDIQKEGETYTFKHAYNPSTGTIDDLIETFWQLKESGQIDEGYFTFITGTLAGTDPTSDYFTRLQEIISQYNGDVDTMFTIYQNSSFNQRHNVLLVAHSQGNLFGNKMYTLMSEAQKKKFRMVSVATPADHVAGGGPYVTASGDYVINPIPGALPSNVDGVGHTFIGTYLNGSINAPRKIALYVKSAYDNLLQASSCSIYQQIFMRVPDNLSSISVFGTPTGTNIFENIGSVPLYAYDAEYVRDQYGNLIDTICNNTPVYIYGDQRLFYGDSRNGHFSYRPGVIFNKETLEARKNLSHSIQVIGAPKCVDITFDGDLYDLAMSALSNLTQAYACVHSPYINITY